MSATHSIWLMPNDSDLEFLQEIVHRLSARFGTPRFCPHLTLVEDMPRAQAELSALLAEHFIEDKVFTSAITAISGLPMFYRSLYAAFAAEDPLLELKSRSVRVFAKGDVAGFMPHISLAYGFGDEQRSQVSEHLGQELHGRQIEFNAIAVVASAQTIPIEDWRIVYKQELKRG